MDASPCRRTSMVNALKRKEATEVKRQTCVWPILNQTCTRPNILSFVNGGKLPTHSVLSFVLMTVKLAEVACIMLSCTPWRPETNATALSTR